MKTPVSLTVLIFVAMNGLVSAQTDASAVSVAAERSRIVAERARLETGYLLEDAACYRRFAVNNCLEEVNSRRRETTGDLRRQEVLLNEQERKRKGAEQLRRTEEKAVLESQQAETDRRNKAALDAQSRLDRDQDRKDSRLKAGSAEQIHSESRAARIQANQQKNQARAARQANEAEQTKQFNDRQQAAQEKRAKNERDQAQTGKPPAKPLPARP
jgi:colicin import membrane protein